MRRGAKSVIAAALAASVLFGTYARAADSIIKPIVLDNDPGGTISTFVAWFERVRDSGVPVVVRGICESACTLVLMLPREQVCVEPSASFGFHLASSGTKSLPDYTAALIRRYYPPAVQQWLSTKKLTAEPIYMMADEVVALGIFPACAEAK